MALPFVSTTRTPGRGVVLAVTSIAALALATVVLPVAAGATTNQPAASRPLHVVDLGTLRGTCCSQALAINDHGDVVGNSTVAGGENPPVHAVLWRNGHLRDLGTLGGPTSSATDINRYGDVVGYSTLHSGVTHAFLWHNGHLRDLGTLGGESVATGINDNGVVVGHSVDGTGTLVGFRWRNGTMTPLTSTTGVRVLPEDINNNGVIAGEADFGTGPTTSPARWRAGVATQLVDAFGTAYAINAKGHITGGYATGDGRRAFLVRDGVFTPLGLFPSIDGTTGTGVNNVDDVAGSGFANSTARAVWWPRAGAGRELPGLSPGNSEAWDINNCGQIVGSSERMSDGATRAVLWTR